MSSESAAAATCAAGGEVFTARAVAQVFVAAGRPLVEQSVDISLPAPSNSSSALTADGPLLVRITAATVCGSDVHTVEGKRNEPSPLVLGHEGVGVVVWSARAGVGVGERVTFSVCVSGGCCRPTAAAPASSASAAGGGGGECASCRDGLPQKCSKVFKYGHSRWLGPLATATDREGARGEASAGAGAGAGVGAGAAAAPPSAAPSSAGDLSGTYASHIYLRPGSSVHPLSTLPDWVAAPANCALATMVSALEKARVALGGRAPRSVALQGAGLLGLYGAALAAEACAGWMAREGRKSQRVSGSGGGGGGADVRFGEEEEEEEEAPGGSAGGEPLAVVVTDASQARLDLAREFGATATYNVFTGEMATTGSAGPAGGASAVALPPAPAASGAPSGAPSGADASARAALLSHLHSRWASAYAGGCGSAADSPSAAPQAPQGYDVVIEVCGAPQVLPLGLSLLRPGGVYVLVGLVHPNSSLGALTAEAVIRASATLVGVHNYAPGHLAGGLDFLRRHYRPAADGDGARDGAAAGDAAGDAAGAAGGGGGGGGGGGAAADAFSRPLPFHKLVSPPMPLRDLEKAVHAAKAGTWPRVLVVAESA